MKKTKQKSDATKQNNSNLNDEINKFVRESLLT